MKHLFSHIILLISLIPLFSLTAKSDNNDKLMVEHTIKAISNINNSDFQFKIDKLQSAIQNLNNSDYKEGQILLRLELGNLWCSIGIFDKALDELNNAYKLSLKINDKHLTALSLKSLGEITRATTDYRQSLNYLNNALQLFKEDCDTLGIGLTYSRLSAVYYEMNTKYQTNNFYKKSFYYARLAQNIGTKFNNLDLIVSSTNLLGSLYKNYKNYDSAFYYLRQAHQICIQHNLHNEIPIVLMNIAGTYLYKKDYNNAITYGLKALQTSQNQNQLAIVKYSADLLYDTYKSMNKYEQALHYLEISRDAQNQLYNYELMFKNYSIQTKYEKGKEEAKLEAANKEIILWTILFFLLVVISVFVIILIIKRNKKQLRINNALESLNELISTQNTELEELNTTKDKFFSIIAHDLKNPLSSIMQLTRIMNEMYSDLSEEELKDFLNNLHNSTQKLTDLLDNLLTWARSQRGIIEFKPSNVELYESAEAVKYILQTQAENKGISIINEVPNHTNLYADTNMISTVIRNLVSNSIKFTNNNGKIIIGIAEQNADSTCIFVKDNGVGMSQETTELLFRIDIHNTSIGSAGEKGTGLGLILCKEFVEKHGGKIWVESKINEGSTFYFSIPNLAEEDLH